MSRCGAVIAECRITFEGTADRSDSPAPYVVKIDLSMPGARIHADSLHLDGTGHKDVCLALRAAFKNAHRELQHPRHDPSRRAQRR